MFVRKTPIIRSYSFRTFSFYRPENKLKINFLVVHYILKRKAQYWAFRSAPLGDIWDFAFLYFWLVLLIFVLEVVPRQRRVPPFFIEVYS